MKLRLATYFLFLFSFSFCFSVLSQNTIKLTIKNMQNEKVMIAYFSGDKQYILGNKNGKNQYFKFDQNGNGEFKSEEFKKGMYLLVFSAEKNEFIQFLYDENDLNISLDRNSLQESIRFKNSLSNTLFFQHVLFIKKLTVEKNEILKNLKKGVNDDTISKKMSLLDKKYKQFYKEFTNKYSDNIAAQFLKASNEVKIPLTYKTQQERFVYYKANYFNNMNFNHEWLIRTPFFYKKIMYYLEKLTTQNPNEINKSVDLIIEKAKDNPELFKYLVTTLLNKYAKSKMMFGPNIYAHIVKTYYVSGKANWVEKTQLAQIIENYNNIKNSLLGSKVNDFQLISSTGETSKLYDDKSEYKILYFWNTDYISSKKLNDHFTTKPQNTKVYSILKNSNKNHLKNFVTSEKQLFPPTIISDKDRSLVRKELFLHSYLKVFLLNKNNVIIGNGISIKQAFEIINQYSKQ